jgi:uncharacterized protein YjlB
MITKPITAITPVPRPEGLNEPKITSKVFKADGNFPNNEFLPVLIYHGAFDLVLDDPASQIEDTFSSNLWGGIWRNGIYPYHHYHSTSHEILACYSGDARVQLGGPSGMVTTLKVGDCVVIPAGVAHKNLGSSANFRILGAYPRGQHNYDLRRGLPGERPRVDEHIARVALPDTDPIYGAAGPLVREWKLIEQVRKVPTTIKPHTDIAFARKPSPGKFSVREQ